MKTIDTTRVRRILAGASGRPVLLETEGLDLLAAIGIEAPPFVYVRSSEEAFAADTSLLAGDRVVVKVISPQILHKSDVGGVRVVEHRREAIVAAIADMEARLGGREIVGFTINQFLRYDATIGSELILGLRWTADFGPVVTLGAGGIYTEFLAENFKGGREIAVFAPGITTDAEIEEAVGRLAIGRLATGRLRGQPPRIEVAAIVDSVRRFMALAAECVPHEIVECEINPLVITRAAGVPPAEADPSGRGAGVPPASADSPTRGAGVPPASADSPTRGAGVSPANLIALDILVKLGNGRRPEAPARPLEKLKRLLEPRSAAIVGVSEKLNPGRIILNNLLREGFDRDRIFIVKPGCTELAGCRCVPDIASLPERVDLFILAIAAAQTPQAITAIVEGRKAESIIVIPGGLEEKSGTEAIVGRMREALAASRSTEWRGPLINGGNCLGVRSLPGRYDTMFIPEYKLPVPSGQVSPVAFVSQSGAFAVSRMSKLGRLNPKYAITLGNQMDLTVSDYLAYLKDDPGIGIFAVYVEGFKELDGLTFLRAAREITASGRSVILYRAGRTAAGAKASASHTASIAGDYTVTRELAKAAGVVVADSLSDFEDLVSLFTLLEDKRVDGTRLGAVSNAGFECVAIADTLGLFQLPPFDAPTSEKLEEVFRNARIDSVVDVHNPIDLTPMAGDSAYEAVVRTVLASGGIDVGLVGCVPLTSAMNTLPSGDGHGEDLTRPDGIGLRLARIKSELPKAWAAVVDAGRLYDPLVELLEQHGVPTFRTADTALRLLNVFVSARLRAGQAARV